MRTVKNKKLWQWILDAVVWCLCLMALLWVLSNTRGRLVLYDEGNLENNTTEYVSK